MTRFWCSENGTHVLAVLCVSSLFLTGCATISEEQCRSFDWKKDGYRAGFWGESRDQRLAYLTDERKACREEYGIAHDAKSFELGFQQGREDLCTKDGAYKFGAGGGVYRGHCDKAKEDEFFLGYQRGQMVYTSAKIHELEGSVQKLNAELKRKNDEIDSLEKKNRELESKVKALNKR